MHERRRWPAYVLVVVALLGCAGTLVLAIRAGGSASGAYTGDWLEADLARHGRAAGASCRAYQVDFDGVGTYKCDIEHKPYVVTVDRHGQWALND